MENDPQRRGNALDFCRNFVWLNGQPICFDQRPYLPDVYRALNGNLILRCSRQVEKSTLLVNAIVYLATRYPGIKLLLVCPRREQAGILINTRLKPLLDGSPFLRRLLLGKSANISVMNQVYSNGSQLFVRAAFRSADAVRGVSADVLLIDEFQDIANGDLPVLQETLSHSSRAQTIITGTPKLIDNHLEGVFRISTACEWHVPCTGCQTGHTLDERVLGSHQIECKACRMPLDVARGKWVARNPTSSWGHGYWINHLMVPWLGMDDVLARRQAYDPVRFKNECLGQPATLGDHLVTREEIEACCTARPMAASAADVPSERRHRLVAGLDWGGGTQSATVLVIGEMDDRLSFTVHFMERYHDREAPEEVLAQVAKRCAEFGVQAIAADGAGNGHVYNRLLAAQLSRAVPFYAILYSSADQEPHPDGVLWKWTVNRSATLGTVFSRIKLKSLLFPRVADSGSFLDEFTCELAEYDDHMRSIRYTHPETQPDDALHATNYALLVAVRKTHGEQLHG